MMNYVDFEKEKLGMEVLFDRLSAKICNKKSIKLLVSPKYHYKLASEGVEHAQGLGIKILSKQRAGEKMYKKQV